MVNRFAGGFDKLEDSFISSAARALEQIAPEYVSTFREGLGQAGDLEHALNAVKDMQVGPQFNKWRNICTALLDVRLAMHQVETSLTLLDLEAPQQVSQGEWVYYHLAAWSIWMDGLLERVAKLVKKVVRQFVRPANPEWRRIETEILRTVESFDRHMGKLRDPIPHGGGAFVESPAGKQLLEGRMLIAGHIDMDLLLDSLVHYQHRWHELLLRATVSAFAEIDRLSERLQKEVRWQSAN